MKIVFRADASNNIGTGHIMRCLVLAQILREYGHNIQFSTRSQKGDLINFITSKNFKVKTLNETSTSQLAMYESYYKNPKQVSEFCDAINFIAETKRADIVVVDHYLLEQVWEQTVKNELNCKIVVIDDLKRRHSCDLLFDVTLGRKIQEYHPYVPNNCKVLTGCEYALLKPQFIKKRKQISLLPQEKKHKLLISMGGIDNTNITLKILTELANFDSSLLFDITVLISPKSPYYLEVLEYIKTFPRKVTQVDFVENMAELILEHTIAIGAPGGSAWERVSLGMPCLLIVIAENQKEICKKLTQEKAAVSISIDKISKLLPSSLTKLIIKYEHFRDNAKRLCDARGLYRVNFHINALSEKRQNYFHNCRLATKDDIQQVYAWQTQPETRKFANNSNIPTYVEHVQWMKDKLSSTTCFFYIIEINTDNGPPMSAGVVRLDEITKNNFIVSIYVTPEHYLKSLAIDALNFIDHVHPDCQINAKVLSKNLASHKLFSKAGYKRIDNEHYQRSTITRYLT